jgi:DNA-binding transcriptional MerR regulator
MDNSKNIISGGGLFKEEELSAIEVQNPDGLSSGAIIGILANRGIKFSEATFRKYVQLGLLPRSRRVGSKGKHKGSRGLYPAGTIRQINEIKRMMALDYTIEEIRCHFAFVGGEIEELRALLERILDRLEEGLKAHDSAALSTSDLREEVRSAKVSADDLIERIEHSAERLKKLGQLAKEAV